MTYKKKSWKEKLADDKNYPKIEPLTGKMIEKWGKGDTRNSRFQKGR
jgi:hypothetical protein